MKESNDLGKFVKWLYDNDYVIARKNGEEVYSEDWTPVSIDKDRDRSRDLLIEEVIGEFYVDLLSNSIGKTK